MAYYIGKEILLNTYNIVITSVVLIWYSTVSQLHICILLSQDVEYSSLCYVVVQLLHLVWLFVTLWTAACQTLLSFTVSQSLLKIMPIELVMLSNHLILWHPLLLFSLIFPSIRVFSSENTKSSSLCYTVGPCLSISYVIICIC